MDNRPFSSPLDPETLKRLRRELTQRLQRLEAILKRSEGQTSAELPKDWPEAAAMKGDLELGENLEGREAIEIQKIREALQRIEVGTYGICAGCARPIPIERLEARPYSDHCLHCKEDIERRSRS